ncbi:hypothetical protein Y032_0008g4 [Ancylostoma ceylanicum]|uniref:Mos1 transposase HTH domain-containing protein n=1 Tax=Ancylostoma ceylanicum TaxID=53326 RepID=A0A016VLA0_9BILA|nr:hypothetical protein Y032_0008g4 [Ancylostoma ceylanicum]
MDEQPLRAIVLYEHRRGTSARRTADNINAAFGSTVVSHATVSRWFQRLGSGDRSLQSRSTTGRPPELKDDDLRKALEERPTASTSELAQMLGRHHSTIADRLYALGYRRVMARWIPHELTDATRAARVSICQSLLLLPNRTDFLANVVTGDESWVRYHNDTRVAYWLPREEEPPAQPRPNPHARKALLCCFWDARGMLFWELLTANLIVSADVYSRQLRDLASAIRGKRRRRVEVHLLHDNARPHLASTTRRQLEELGWTTVPHPPYSPDLTPSDYHLFRSLKNFLAGQRFTNFQALQTAIGDFFERQNPEFWRRGIESLPDRWLKVVDTYGDYTVS